LQCEYGESEGEFDPMKYAIRLCFRERSDRKLSDYRLGPSEMLVLR